VRRRAQAACRGGACRLTVSSAPCAFIASHAPRIGGIMHCAADAPARMGKRSRVRASEAARASASTVPQ
jgi:hypothetical protein